MLLNHMYILKFMTYNTKCLFKIPTSIYFSSVTGSYLTSKHFYFVTVLYDMTKTESNNVLVINHCAYCSSKRKPDMANNNNKNSFRKIRG